VVQALPELLLPVALTVAVPRVVRAATKVPVVAQQTYAHQHQSTIALSLPEVAVEPVDSLVVPVARPVVYPELLAPTGRARVVQVERNLPAVTAVRQTVAPGAPVVHSASAALAEPAQPQVAVAEEAVITVAVVAAPT
jgi:hypothetical protein